jgi:hypothetical protein
MANIETGIYRLKQERTFRCGISVFTRQKGSHVRIKKVDEAAGNVLIEFSFSDWCWLPISEMKYLEKTNIEF